MYINKLILKEFGKFNNRELKFKPGLNVVYGRKDSGKTTIGEFVPGMLYGIDKQRSIGSRQDHYQMRKPVGGKGYLGKMYVTNGGKSHLLERNFSRTYDGAALTEIETGKAVQLKHNNSYNDILFDTDKSTYMNSMYITDAPVPEAELPDYINTYTGHMIEAQSPDINKENAIKYLNHERKKYIDKKLEAELNQVKGELDEFPDVDKNLEDIREERREELDAYNIEIARLKREARQLLDEEKSEIPDEDEDRERERIFLEVDALVEDNEPEKKKLSDNPFIIMLTGIMVVVVVMLMTHLLDFQKSVQQLFSICTIAFVAITIIDGMYRKGIISGDDSTPDEEEFERTLYELGRATESRTVRIEIDKEFQDNHDAKLAELKAREEIAVEDRNAYYELKDRYKKLLERFNILETEKNAIDMAIGKIKGISSEISANLSTSLIANISENICAITEGRINGVSLDEENHLSVIINDRAAALEALDTDSLKKLYLAVRLSVAQLLKTERLPLVMDVNLKAYQLTTLLNCLSKIDTDQIILLTDVDMRKSLDEMSINYEYVEL